MDGGEFLVRAVLESTAAPPHGAVHIQKVRLVQNSPRVLGPLQGFGGFLGGLVGPFQGLPIAGPQEGVRCSRTVGV